MSGIILLSVYVAVFVVSMLVVAWITRTFLSKKDFTALKTVTFGDESAVRANRFASVISILTIIGLWFAFTNTFHIFALKNTL